MSTEHFNIDEYMNTISAVGLLTREEEHELAKRYHEEKDQDAFQALVAANLRFVVKVAHGFKGYGLPMGDLIQEGNIGLMLALRKFNPHQGTRLISYAVFWIRAQINTYVMRSWSVVKLGTNQTERKMFFKVRSTRSRFEFEERLSPELVTQKLAEEFDTDEATVLAFENRFSNRDDSMSSLPYSSNEDFVPKQYESEQPSPEELVAHLESSVAFNEAVRLETEKCDDRDKFILGHRLLSEEPKPLREIAKIFRISPERVRQLEARILANLRKRLETLQFFPQAAA